MQPRQGFSGKIISPFFCWLGEQDNCHLIEHKGSKLFKGGNYLRKLRYFHLIQVSHTHQGVEGAHDLLGNSASTDLIRQAKGEPGKVPVHTNSYP